MKKKYVVPVAEKIEFCYSDQVVASQCIAIWMNQGDYACDHGNSYLEPYNNT